MISQHLINILLKMGITMINGKKFKKILVREGFSSDHIFFKNINL